MKTKTKQLLKYFKWYEYLIYFIAIASNIVVFVLTSSTEYLNLIASLLGITALVFLAKGNIIGQFLTIIFSTMYAYISFDCQYYGEVATYLFMTAPIALASIVSWAKHPFQGKKDEVEINEIPKKEYLLIFSLSILVTFIFYFVLNWLGTDNVYISTISVFSSFIASYLTFRRSRFYAVAYATNDLILIALWIYKTIGNINYISVVICFIAFFVFDLYGFICWSKRMVEQKKIKDGCLIDDNHHIVE